MNELEQKQEALLKEAAEYTIKMWSTDDVTERMQYSKHHKAKQFEAALLYPEMNEETIIGAFCCVESHYYWDLFEKICGKYELSPKVFAIGLKEAWTMGVGTGDPQAIANFRKVDGRLMMDEKEQEYFDALPEDVTLYRGCCINELNYLKGEDDEDNDGSCLGISWTTDRGVAEFFAFRDEYNREDRVVVSAVVKKSSIITFINDRGEYECIFLDIFSIKPQIVTSEPTEYYDEYLERKEAHMNEFIGFSQGEQNS